MASEIFKFESVDDDDDDDGPLVYYKLTLWVFGSSELKTKLSWTDRQRKNSIPHHKQSLQGV